MKVAVLGLGRMGQAVAGRLLEQGYEVTVWNRTPGKDQDLVAHGAKPARSVAEAVREVDAALSLLTADAAVREVYLGEGGVIASLAEWAVAVDMSTVSPKTSREMGEAIGDGRFVDAPILGSPSMAAQGRPRLLLGGERETITQLDPLWSDLGSGYTYCGRNGAATTMKLLSNLNLVGGTILLAEAVATALASGIAPEVAAEVFGTSPAVAPGVRVRLDDIMSGDHQGWWTITLAEKDIDLVLDVASSAGLSLTLGQAARRVLEETEQIGFGEMDLGAVVEAVRGSGAGQVSVTRRSPGSHGEGAE